MKNEIIQRPITPIEEFEIALNKAELSDEDYELIDYIRYTSVFTQPSLVRDLKKAIQTASSYKSLPNMQENWIRDA